MALFNGKPDWSDEGRDWPNRQASQFVFSGEFIWHVQVMGSGPTLLLLHGAGAASHSWRDLAPLLARDFTVIAPDLPGHGFTDTPRGDGLSLQGMSKSLSVLLSKMGAKPDLTVGHSAGAAIGMRMRSDGRLKGGLVSLNGALRPFPGAAGLVFPAMAQLLFLNPVAQRLFAWRAARPGAVDRLIRSTGSVIDQTGLRCYEALLSTPGHIMGSLGMMARWNLIQLQKDMPALDRSLTLVASAGDKAVPVAVAEEVHAVIAESRLLKVPDLGHLAHEEAPDLFAGLIRTAWSEA